MKYLKRILLVLLAVVVLAAVAMLIPPSWPDADAPPHSPPGLQRRCTVSLGEHDIPTIRARSLEAAAYCWGLMHGRTRAWQLDHLRRVAYGRVAEVHGMQHARQDFFLRLLDFAGLADRWRAALGKTSPATLRLLQYYAWGVNRGLPRGVEASYQLQELGQQPAPWRVQDSLAIALLQSFHQTKKTFIDDLKHAALRGKMGPRRYAELYPARPAETTIIKAGEHPLVPAAALRRGAPAPSPGAESHAELAQATLAYLQQASPGPLPGAGSNNWVIGPSRSHSGHAMLASDPHLAITTPSFWYELKLQVSGKVRAMGLGVPGLPGLMVGSTEHLAWGLTNGYSNVADVFRVKPGEGGSFTLGGKSYERRSFRPLVRVRIGPLYLPVFWKSFSRSELGPFLPLPAYAEGSVLLRWTAFHQRPGTIQAALDLLQARTVQQADRALSRWQLPCWNLVFADSSGGIGYRQVGLVARRRAGARGLVEAAAADQQWQGFLEPREMPHLLNPARGYIVTANNRAFPHGYPFYMGQAYAWSQRAARIEALIQSKPRLSLADLRRIQLDTRVPQAALLLPRMLELLGPAGQLKSPHAARARELLGAWDLQARRDRVAPAIFRYWLQRLQAQLVQGLSPRPRDQLLARMLRGEVKPQTSQPLPALARQTFEAALAALAADLGPDPSAWRWGRVHVTAFSSLLKERGAWSPGDQGTDGDKRTVNVADYSEDRPPFRVSNAPSYRMLVELGPRLTSRGVLAGKQVDRQPKLLGPQQKMWLRGAYRPRVLPDRSGKADGKAEQITF